MASSRSVLGNEGKKEREEKGGEKERFLSEVTD
jgi:hypothetical protein